MQQDQWAGVALDSQIQPSSSNPAILHGQALAVWRSEAGPVNIWEDRCPHRGMRLSFGFVRDNTLRCIYHGWGYAADGQCTVIPAHPDLTPPKTICAAKYPSESRYGIVWTNLTKDPLAKLPNLGPDEGWHPIRSLYISRPARQTCDAISAALSGWGNAKTLGDGIVTANLGQDTELLVAIQPVDAETTGIHAVAKGALSSTVDGRRDLARKLERLRNEIEAR